MASVDGFKPILNTNTRDAIIKHEKKNLTKPLSYTSHNTFPAYIKQRLQKHIHDLSLLRYIRKWQICHALHVNDIGKSEEGIAVHISLKLAICFQLRGTVHTICA